MVGRMGRRVEASSEGGRRGESQVPEGEMGEAAGTTGVVGRGGGGVMGSLGSDNDAGWKDAAVTFNVSLIVGGKRVSG